MPTYRRRQSDNPFRDVSSSVNRANRATGMRYLATVAAQDTWGTSDTRIGNRLRIRDAVDNNGVYTASDRVWRNANRLTRGSMPRSFRRETPGQISMFDNSFSVQPRGGTSTHSP